MSGRPLSKKLFLREGYVVLLVNAPADYEEKLGEVPEGVSFVESRVEPVDFIHLFIKDREELEENLEGLKPLLKPKGLLWVSYPKGSSGVKTDVNRDSIWAYAKTIGWMPSPRSPWIAPGRR